LQREQEDRIVDSWQQNATPWTRAVREGEIGSRVAVTNGAILSVLRALGPARLLDVGCGEGWLCHGLAREGTACVGVDMIPDLVEAARAAHPAGAAPATYLVHDYDAIAAGALHAAGSAPFDVIVSNFALIGDRPVARLLQALPALLAPGGRVVIQTLHPVMSSLDAPYQDGWREGSWSGFAADFRDPAPWYFRTISGWVALLGESGLTLERMIEPVHPETGRPASLILMAR
jgi:2-polyprenyl-3-methyl-5-hydroxy-6-metoxy-1,4-benzoquinol methylase